MIKKIFLILAIVLFIISCSDSNPLTDSQKNRLSSYGEIRKDTLFAVADTFIVSGKVNTGNSPKLLIGAFKSFETRFLLKFNNIPPDSVLIDSLKLIFNVISNFGNGINPITGTAYMVLQEWDENVNTDPNWDYASNIDLSPFTSKNFEIPANDSAQVIINLPDSLLSVWNDTTSGNRNFGLLLNFTSAEHIKEIASSESVLGPRLVSIYRNVGNDSTIRDTSSASIDASLIDFLGSFNNDSLYVSAGYAAHTFFKFNFDSLPENTIVSSVNFFFEQDTINSIINTNHSQTIYVRNVITDFSELKIPYFEIDSSFTSNIFYIVPLTEKNNNQLSLDNIRRAEVGQYFIQSLINKEINHGSFYLQYQNEGYDISVYALHGVDSPQIEQRPRMVIEYFINPETRI